MRNSSLYTLIFTLLLWMVQIKPEGFFPGTLVKTPTGYSPIEQLYYNATISFDYKNNQIETLITQTITFDYHCCIKITVSDSEIYCAPDQKFYSYNHQQWITADKLVSTDLLMNDTSKPITIHSIEIIPEQCTLHALSLKTNHTYCISQHNIIAHNAGPLIVIFTPVVVSTVVPIVKTCLTVGASLIGAHLAKKIAHKKSAPNQDYNASVNNYGGNWHDPHDPNNDKNKTKNDEHPHGIYKDAPYHHKNAKGNKSKSPNDGQHCLDYSLPTEGKERIAIEGKNFVILKYTSPGQYHGYIVEWKQLEETVKNILTKGGFVKRSGKVIKQIVEKSLL